MKSFSVPARTADMRLIPHRLDRPQLYLGLLAAVLLWTAAFALSNAFA